MRSWLGNGGWISESAQQRLRELKPDDVKSIAIIRHAALGGYDPDSPIYLLSIRLPQSHFVIGQGLVKAI